MLPSFKNRTTHTYIIMKRYITRTALCILVAAWICMPVSQAQSLAEDDTTTLFRFLPGNDMFFVPWSGNGARLDSLCLAIKPDAIPLGSIRVDGYSDTKKLSKIRCNRVKSELINRVGLKESHFATTNNTGKFRGLNDVVIVTLPAPRQDEPAPAPQPPTEPEATAEPRPEPNAEPATCPVAQAPTVHPAEPAGKGKSTVAPLRRWNVGANGGIPFFWSDMVSIAADNTYIGFSAGVQGGYRLSQLLGISLSADYARGKAGARDYARGYRLAPDGKTYYTPQSFTTETYGNLYSRISVVSVGLSLDVNLNRIFSRNAQRHRFTVWVSPAVYANLFNAEIRTKAGDRLFSDGTASDASLSLGVGGAVTLRYRVSPGIELQLKNSLSWITDNRMDGITVKYDHARQNAMWLPQLGIIWNIN